MRKLCLPGTHLGVLCCRDVGLRGCDEGTTGCEVKMLQEEGPAVGRGNAAEAITISCCNQAGELSSTWVTPWYWGYDKASERGANKL